MFTMWFRNIFSDLDVLQSICSLCFGNKNRSKRRFFCIFQKKKKLMVSIFCLKRICIFYRWLKYYVTFSLVSLFNLCRSEIFIIDFFFVRNFFLCFFLPVSVFYFRLLNENNFGLIRKNLPPFFFWPGILCEFLTFVLLLFLFV